MPDHVHMVFTPLEDDAGRPFGFAEIMNGIKGASSHSVNRMLKRTGRVWQAESFDRVVRCDESMIQKAEYILANPIRKGLVCHERDYSWLWKEGEPLPDDVATLRDEVSREAERRARAAGALGVTASPAKSQPGATGLHDLSVHAVHRKLMTGPWRGLNVALLHGGMSTSEKDAILRDFVAGKLHAMVSTTVVEVGVDVANATIMVVEHADRFGLSQLHQLRGRVGRGVKDSVCVLIAYEGGMRAAPVIGANPKSKIQNPKPPSAARSAVDARRTPVGPVPTGPDFGSPLGKAAERLAVLAETTDGFKIAEADLRQRGPGELLGTRQHGLPELRFGDIVDDFEVLEKARRDAFDIVARDPALAKPEHAAMLPALRRMFGEKLALIDAG